MAVYVPNIPRTDDPREILRWRQGLVDYLLDALSVLQGIPITTSGDIIAGNWINIFNNSGTLGVRKANATAITTDCDGFILADTYSGKEAQVYFTGMNTKVSGKTIGSTYYLSKTAGGDTTDVSAGAGWTTGNIRQRLGKAFSATSILFMKEIALKVA